MIVLITPTGARAPQFKLCAQWMKKQTYQGKVSWIIVDDAVPISTKIVQPGFRDGWDIIKVFPTPPWRGQNTQARNIRVGIESMKMKYDMKTIKAIFIIEDDDYYSPRYLERMMSRLNGFALLGETNTIYYNVVYRMYMINANTIHASLFQTAFTPENLQTMTISYANKFIDVELWKRGIKKHLFFEDYLSIGIKGMPGRSGIGAGHKPSYAGMRQDKELNFLKRLIGQEDASKYAGYYRHYSKPQYSRFITKRHR